MKTKAICPKCSADIQLWRGQIGVCTATVPIWDEEDLRRFEPRLTERKFRPCNWQGAYPERVEVEEKD